jgi:hypothetical protein
MEASCTFHPADHRKSDEWIGEFIFLFILLRPETGSPIVVAAGASKSNLFFSRMFGASAEPQFGLALQQRPTL